MMDFMPLLRGTREANKKRITRTHVSIFRKYLAKILFFKAMIDSEIFFYPSPPSPSQIYKVSLTQEMCRCSLLETVKLNSFDHFLINSKARSKVSATFGVLKKIF